MERDKSYPSNSALGQMYNRIQVEEFHAAYEMSFDVRVLSRYPLDEDTLAKAGEIKAAYDVAMRRLIGQHETPVTEFEIWSTFILSKPRVGSDFKLQENVGRDMAALKDRFRAECKMAVTGNSQTQSPMFPSSMVDLEKLDRFVAAMYTVTHNEVRASARERLMAGPDNDDGPEEVQIPLISFPWLFHRELARLALGQGGDVRPLKMRNGDLALDDGGFGVPGVTVSPATVAMEEVNQPAQLEGGGSVVKGGDSADEGHTRVEGQVVHRGQILTLFTESGEQSKAQQDTAAEHMPIARSISNNSMVPDDSTGSSAAASPRTAHRSEDDDEYVEFEEVGDDGQEEEDALEVLARKIGM